MTTEKRQQLFGQIEAWLTPPAVIAIIPVIMAKVYHIPVCKEMFVRYSLPAATGFMIIGAYALIASTDSRFSVLWKNYLQTLFRSCLYAAIALTPYIAYTTGDSFFIPGGMLFLAGIALFWIVLPKFRTKIENLDQENWLSEILVPVGIGTALGGVVTKYTIRHIAQFITMQQLQAIAEIYAIIAAASYCLIAAMYIKHSAKQKGE